MHNSYARVYSQLTLIQVVAEPFIFRASNGTIVRKAGDSVVLWCVASGKPKPDIMWSKVREMS